VVLQIHKSPQFLGDIVRQIDWYREKESAEIADRFVVTVQATVEQLARIPTLGRPRFSDHPQLRGTRSHRVKRPFFRFLIFYRFDNTQLFAERLIHGARDLPNALSERE
jgi:plasmid stabilization system protein ParE